ncbi:MULTISPECIES: archaetidylinositol phosphate synthase [Sulfurisphaera]|uniref:Archaetidylinositol phosphate synthase n=2 Tax=Sulfurisphaera tokodaii TaxID=111955 RepID=Q971C3_SULTO|nr:MULTISPECIES: archaetidylinositol phosphate synthase [Sulfurisphaera]BAB66497.1 putative archaetidylinositol phosphate synthase [Sulfurisphaera tokodaii str. 7]HII73687.1 CDP-alcohol phosphatidyltransferase family protein [Sulfurisphaera tokodaii]
MMVLITKIRKQSKKILQPIALALIKINVSANTITFVGLILSFLYLAIMYFLKDIIIGLILLALSAFMDAIDGEVARLSNKAGSKGSFLDSSLDRIEDINYISGLFSLGFTPLLIGLLIGVSVTISYLRAKAESLGIKMEGRGIIERGERIMFLVILLLLYLLSFTISYYFFLIFLILSIITVIQRFIAVYSSLP